MTSHASHGNPRLPIHAAHGTELTAKSWQTEAPLRMLMNNLDPDNAERPEDLVVYGGTGKAARSWEAYDALVRTLRDLEADETLLVQSGKPVGVMRTHEWAPRVLIANSNLVGDWANWEEFRRLEDLGLTMYGQMTAGSWIYIGTQGILQGTFETFAAVADKRFGGTLAGTITVTAGLGGMGGAQPLAVTMNDGVAICIECDQHRIDRRLETRYLDVQARDLDHAIELALEARDARRGLSIGLLGNAAELVPELLERHLDGSVRIDIVTDQTSAHDPLFYLPAGTAYDDWERERTDDPRGFASFDEVWKAFLAQLEQVMRHIMTQQYAALEMKPRHFAAPFASMLHDLAMAARYADHVVAMRDGEVVAQGSPVEVVTEELVSSVFDIRCRILTDPDTGTPVVLPRGMPTPTAKDQEIS